MLSEGENRACQAAPDAPGTTELSTEDYRAIAASHMPEKQLQNLVRNTAITLGWRFYHPWISVKSAAGFPDCTLIRGERLAFVELKAEAGEVTAAQTEWLDAFRGVSGVEVYIWRPGDWFAGTIEEVLR